MTDAGFNARILAVDWHANFWQKLGVPRERCEAMRDYCVDCVEADFFGEERAETSDPELARMQAYLDRLFSGPNVARDGWGSLVSFD